MSDDSDDMAGDPKYAEFVANLKANPFTRDMVKDVKVPEVKKKKKKSKWIPEGE